MVRKNRTIAVCLVMLSLSATLASAQSSHVERLQAAGIACLQDVLSSTDAISLDADERAPYLRPALIARWKSDGVAVFRMDSTASLDPISAFRYRVDDVQMKLEHAGAGQVTRTAIVSLRYALVGPEGQILDDDLCSSSLVDAIPASQANQFADPRYPETNIQYQHRGWLRRILEPAVVIGAAVIGTYLFFNLRSKRAEGG